MRPRPPTYLRFKDAYNEGDQRFGARRGKKEKTASVTGKSEAVEMQNVGVANGR